MSHDPRFIGHVPDGQPTRQNPTAELEVLQAARESLTNIEAEIARLESIIFKREYELRTK